jgi:hypothetical protein
MYRQAQRDGIRPILTVDNQRHRKGIVDPNRDGEQGLEHVGLE